MPTSAVEIANVKTVLSAETSAHDASLRASKTEITGYNTASEQAAQGQLVLREAVTQLSSGLQGSVTQQANATAALTALQTRAEAAQRTLLALADAKPQITESDNFAEATRRAQALAEFVTQVKAQNPIPLDVKDDTAVARADLAELTRQIAGLKAEKPVITPEVNAAPAVAAVRQISAAAAESKTHLMSLQEAASGLVSGLGRIGMAGLGLQTVAQTAKMAADALGVTFNANLESATTAFTGLLGSSRAAGDYLQTLQQFADKTPFDFPQVEKAAQRFMGMGMAASSVIPELRDIGNAVAKIGGSNPELERTEVAISQIVAKGKVSAEEVNQLAENGIAAWQILANYLHKSVAEIMADAKAGAISADTFLKAFHQANVGDDMAKQALTYKGAMSTISDSVNMALGQAFKPLFNELSADAQAAAKLTSSADFQGWATTVAGAVGGAVNVLKEIPKVFTDTAAASPIAVGAVAAVTVALAALTAQAIAAAAVMAIATAPITVPLLIIAGGVAALKVAYDNDFLHMKQTTNEWADAVEQSQARVAAGTSHYSSYFSQKYGNEMVAGYKANAQAAEDAANQISAAQSAIDNSSRAAKDAAGVAAAAQTVQMAHLSTDFDKLAPAVVDSLEKMGTAVGGKTADINKGIVAGYALLRQQIPPELEGVRQSVILILEKARAGGYASADAMRADILRVTQSLHSGVSDELNALVTDAENTMAVGASNTGIAWIDNLMNQFKTGQPAVDAYVTGLLKEFDLTDAFAILGHNAAAAFGNNLVFTTANALNTIPKLFDQVGGLLGHATAAAIKGPLDTMGKDLIAVWGNVSHQFEGFAGKVDFSAPIVSHAAKAKGAGADAAKALAQSMEQIVAAVGSAARDTEGPSASIAKGLSDILTVARERVPKEAAQIQASLQDLIRAYQAGTLTLDQENKRMRDILTGLTHDPNVDLSLLAQSQLDNLSKMETQAATAAGKVAAKLDAELLKAQKSAIDDLGGIAQALQDPNVNIGDVWVRMLGTLDPATKAGFDPVVAYLTHASEQAAAGVTLNAQQLNQGVLGALHSLDSNSSPLVRAMAQKWETDIAAAATAIIQKQAELRQAVAGGWSSIIGDLTTAAPQMGTAVKDMLALSKQAAEAGMGDIASTLTGDAQALWSEQAGAWDKGRTDVLAILDTLRHSSDLVTAANAEEMYQAYQTGWGKIAQAAQQTALDVTRALGSLGKDLMSPSASAPAALQATYDLIQKLQTAGGHGNWAATLQADADAVANGVPGALRVMSADVLSILVGLEQSSDPIIRQWAQLQVIAIRGANQQVQDQAAQLAASARQSLANSLSGIGTGLLSGKDSPLQAAAQLGPLMKAALDAGLPGVAQTIQGFLATLAGGGAVSTQAMLAAIADAEQQLAASGDTLAAVQARLALQQLANAAAAASYNTAIAQQNQLIQQTTAAQKAAQDAATRASAAYQNQQTVVQGLQKAYQDAQTSLSAWQNAQLKGTEANTAAGRSNKAAQDLVKLAQDELKSHGGDAAAAAAALTHDYQKILAAHKEAEDALRGQIAGAKGDEKSNLQKQLDQLLKLDAQSGTSYEQALRALQGGGTADDVGKRLQSIADRLATEGSKLATIAGLQLDPLLDALAGVAKATKEWNFSSILKGETDARREMSRLTPEIAAQQSALERLKQAADKAASAAAAINAELQAEQAQLALLQAAQTTAATGTGVLAGQFGALGTAITTTTSAALTPLPAAVTTTLADMSAALDPHLDPGNTAGLLGKWGTTSRSLLSSMLARIGPPAGSGVTGGAYSFRPNATAAMAGTLSDMQDAITTAMPDLLTSWGGDAGLGGMVTMTQSAVQDVKDAIYSLNGLSVTLRVSTSGGTETPPATQGTAVPLTTFATPLAVPPNGPAGRGPIYQNCVFLDGVQVSDDPKLAAILREMAYVTTAKGPAR